MKIRVNIFAYLLLTVLACHSATKQTNAQTIDYEKSNYDLINKAIAKETNARRSKYGLPPLTVSKELNKAAQSHSDDMVRKNFFSHDNPHDSKRKTMQLRIKQSGYKPKNGLCAENIAEYPASEKPETLAKNLLDMWMNSPGHKRNILSETNTEIGTGAAFFKKDKFQFVRACQVFSIPEEIIEPAAPSATPPEAAKQTQSNYKKGDPQLTIFVTNKTSDPLEVRWVDYEGKEKKAGVVPAGAEKHKVGTCYPGNLFRFMINGKLHHSWMVQEKLTHLTIK